MQTKIQYYSNRLGISENELLYELRGYYKPSFFYIYLEGDFSDDVGNLSIKDRGTFVHEYIHYIQNIATYWGLYCSIVRYQELVELKSHLIASENIEIPLNIEYSDSLKNKNEWVKLGNGTSFFTESKSWNIDTTQIISIDKKSINSNGQEIYIVDLTVIFEDKRVDLINLGAHIIKESMAAMYQSLVDIDAKHDDIPYNLVTILCMQHFPTIYSDIEKLICICYTSLFSMSPGFELISLLEIASNDMDFDGTDIFTNFVNAKTITTSKKEKYNIVDYFDVLIAGFKISLETNLQAELDYINDVLERIRLSNRGIPFLSILYHEDKLSIENLNALVGYFGIPYIQTLQSGYHFPKSTKNGAKEDDSSIDVLELVAQEAMFSYLIKPRRDKICPLYYMCSDSQYSKDECFGAPWKEPMCSFTIVSSPFSFDKKNIIWKF